MQSESWRRWRRGGVKALDGAQQSPDSSQLALGVAGALFSVAAVAGGVLFRSLQPFGAPTHHFEVPKAPKTGLSQFGDLGAMLGDLPM